MAQQRKSDGTYRFSRAELDALVQPEILNISVPGRLISRLPGSTDTGDEEEEITAVDIPVPPTTIVDLRREFRRSSSSQNEIKKLLSGITEEDDDRATDTKGK